MRRASPQLVGRRHCTLYTLHYQGSSNYQSVSYRLIFFPISSISSCLLSTTPTLPTANCTPGLPRPPQPPLDTNQTPSSFPFHSTSLVLFRLIRLCSSRYRRHAGDLNSRCQDDLGRPARLLRSQYKTLPGPQHRRLDRYLQRHRAHRRERADEFQTVSLP